MVAVKKVRSYFLANVMVCTQMYVFRMSLPVRFRRYLSYARLLAGTPTTAELGYDPVEMFLDPRKKMIVPRIVLKLIKKKMGFRTLMNVIPLDASLVAGSHGRGGCG